MARVLNRVARRLDEIDRRMLLRRLSVGAGAARRCDYCSKGIDEEEMRFTRRGELHFHAASQQRWAAQALQMQHDRSQSLQAR
jgi:hypothetical protein